MLRRRQLFELNDSPWAPVALRELVVDSLSRTLAWGGILRGLVPPVQDFLRASGASEVLDLCAGAGGPAAILGREIERAGATPPRFLLTDLHPHVETWRALRREHGAWLDYVEAPVDATRIPAELGEGRARMVINALHHFPPALAGEILRGAARGSRGVLVAECFSRDPLGFVVPFTPVGLPALLAAPLFARTRRLEKMLYTWATPLAFAASAWDGLVSTLRIHEEADLRAMVAPLGDAWRWTYGRFAFSPRGRGHFFFGVPAR